MVFTDIIILICLAIIALAIIDFLVSFFQEHRVIAVVLTALAVIGGIIIWVH